ncbi:MAG: restriction endonuclease subunit S [Acidimicrobiales bacterium]
MREGWPTTTLGEVAALSVGRTPPRKDARYWTTDLDRPFCTIADMDALQVNPKREGVTALAEKEGKARRVPAGSLLMSFKLTIGRVGFASRDLFPNEAIVWIQPNLVLDNRFLAIWLGHHDLTAGSGRAVKGNTLNSESLRAIPVALPPLDEQRRIVDLIDALDEQMASLVGVVDRGRVLLGRLRSSLFEAAEAEFPVESLGDASQSRLGKMLSKASKTGVGEFPYVRNIDVQWDQINLTDLNTMVFAEKERAEFSLMAGDVLVCEGGEVGRAAVVEHDLDEIFFQKAIHRVRCGPGLRSRYLMHHLRFCADTGRLANYATQLTIQHLTGEKLRTLPIPLPPIAEQDQMATLLDAVANAVGAASNHGVHLRTVRESLLADLLSGDHEIPASYDELLEAM